MGYMINHATQESVQRAAVGHAFEAALAAEFRAELAVQKRPASDFAVALGITAHTAGRKLAGASSFSTLEMAVGAQWLGIAPDAFVRRVEQRLQARVVAS